MRDRSENAKGTDDVPNEISILFETKQVLHKFNTFAFIDIMTKKILSSIFKFYILHPTTNTKDGVPENLLNKER